MIPVTGPSWPSTPFDGLKLPSGATIGQTDGGTLCREFSRMQVPGWDATMGRGRAVETYAAHLEQIGAAAAEAAVSEYLASKRI